MTSVLLVEDDPLVSSFVEEALRAAGYTTAVAADCARATALGSSGAFDLIILDMLLVDGDGLRVLHELRERSPGLPVLVITGHPERRGVVDCLNSGADDYLVKPLRLDELLARVRRSLRDGAPEQRTTLVGDDLRLDLLTRRVTVAGRTVRLSGQEFDLLEMFLRHPGQVLSREQLLSQVWRQHVDPMTNVVAVSVRKLRGKIGRERIETVRGAGYRLRVGSTRAADSPRSNTEDRRARPVNDVDRYRLARELTATHSTESDSRVEFLAHFDRSC